MNEELAKTFENEISGIQESLKAEFRAMNRGMAGTSDSAIARISELIDAKIRLVRCNPSEQFAKTLEGIILMDERISELETAGAAHEIAHRELQGRVILLEGRKPSDIEMAEVTIDLVAELGTRLSALEETQDKREAHIAKLDTMVIKLIDRYDKLVDWNSRLQTRIQQLEGRTPSSTITREKTPREELIEEMTRGDDLSPIEAATVEKINMDLLAEKIVDGLFLVSNIEFEGNYGDVRATRIAMKYRVGPQKELDLGGLCRSAAIDKILEILKA